MASEIRVNKIINRSGLSTVTFTDDGAIVSGIVSATVYTGSGANLTNLPAGNLSGSLPAINAANLTNIPAANITGTLPAIDGSALTGVGVGTADSINTSGIVTATAFIPTSGQLSHRNLIINGAMQVAQRSQSVSVTDSVRGYQTLDRFEYNTHGTITNVMTMEQSSDSPDGFSNSLKFSTTTADASLTGTQSNYLTTELEGQDLQQLAYGTSSAKSFTLSFYVKGTITGTYVVWFYAPDTGKALTKYYTISSANTWERKTITVAGDTASAIANDNGSGLFTRWILSAGPDYSSGTASTTWATAGLTNANRYVGQTANVAATTSDNWAITGVQLEVGSVATPFEHRSFGDEIARCHRYYQQYTNIMSHGYVPDNGSRSYSHAFTFPVEMRAAPTLTLSNTGSSGGQYVSDGNTIKNITTLNSASNNTKNSEWYPFLSGDLANFRGAYTLSLTSTTYQTTYKFNAEL